MIKKRERFIANWFPLLFTLFITFSGAVCSLFYSLHTNTCVRSRENANFVCSRLIRVMFKCETSGSIIEAFYSKGSRRVSLGGVYVHVVFSSRFRFSPQVNVSTLFFILACLPIFTREVCVFSAPVNPSFRVCQRRELANFTCSLL